MKKSLDEIDFKILRILQKRCDIPLKEISKSIKIPITTVYNRIRRLREMGIIKGCYGYLNYDKIGYKAVAFILASFEYRIKKGSGLISQREIARKIAKLKGVQEVHIISGDWDILIKVRGRDVHEIGNFVLDKLRLIEGIQKTTTCLVFDTAKETLELVI